MTDLELATHAALEAGKFLRLNFGTDVKVDETTDHDIKLALDKESQDLITTILLGARPSDALYGEEGIAGNQDSDRQWIVDPIDGFPRCNSLNSIPRGSIQPGSRGCVPGWGSSTCCINSSQSPAG